MTLSDPESIRDFKKSSDLLKWIHNSGVMNLSVVIIYLIADSTGLFRRGVRLHVHVPTHAQKCLDV